MTPGCHCLEALKSSCITNQPKTQITFHPYPHSTLSPTLRPNIMENIMIRDKFVLNTENSHHNFNDDSMAPMHELVDWKFKIHKPAVISNVAVPEGLPVAQISEGRTSDEGISETWMELL